MVDQHWANIGDLNWIVFRWAGPMSRPQNQSHVLIPVCKYLRSVRYKLSTFCIFNPGSLSFYECLRVHSTTISVFYGFFFIIKMLIFYSKLFFSTDFRKYIFTKLHKQSFPPPWEILLNIDTEYLSVNLDIYFSLYNKTINNALYYNVPTFDFARVPPICIIHVIGLPLPGEFNFSPTYSCVSLPRPTTSSGWKLLIFVKFQTKHQFIAQKLVLDSC